MAQNLELELQKIGLDEREAKVYLAALELGPSPVQKIAQRASVPRATTYLVLDDLKNKGFITTYDEGKKTFFVAQSPERLTMLVDQREVEIERQKNAIAKLIPELISRGQFEKSDRPVVRYYEGRGGFISYLRDILAQREIEIMSLMDHEKSSDLIKTINVDWQEIRKRRKKHKLTRRLISVGDDIDDMKKTHHTGKAMFLKRSDLTLNADIDIIGNFVGFIPYTKPLRAVLIEDEAIATTMAQIFETLWLHHTKK